MNGRVNNKQKGSVNNEPFYKNIEEYNKKSDTDNRNIYRIVV